LEDSTSIAIDLELGLGENRFQPEFLARSRGPMELDRFDNERADRVTLRFHGQVPGLDARDVEEVRDESIHPLCGSLDQVDPSLSRDRIVRGIYLLRETLGDHENGTEWIFEIV
jgi:hypothetical protein